MFRDYWATDEQRQKIINKQKYDRQKLDEKKKEMHSPDNIFKNNKDTIVDNAEKKQEITLIEIKDMKWYKKVWRFLTKFFRK